MSVTLVLVLCLVSKHYDFHVALTLSRHTVLGCYIHAGLYDPDGAHLLQRTCFWGKGLFFTNAIIGFHVKVAHRDKTLWAVLFSESD